MNRLCYTHTHKHRKGTVCVCDAATVVAMCHPVLFIFSSLSINYFSLAQSMPCPARPVFSVQRSVCDVRCAMRDVYLALAVKHITNTPR